MLALDDMLDWFSNEEKSLNKIVQERTQAAESSGTYFTSGNVRAGGSGFVAGIHLVPIIINNHHTN